MTAPTNASVLRPLVETLKACPSRDERITDKVLHQTWAGFRQIALEPGDTVTPAVLVGVILYDPEMLAPLLNGAEHAQLQALGKLAQERYLQLTQPPHKLGKTLAAALKEQT